MASGGKGFLHGTQAQLSFLPEKQTDFAFTMLAEELGFVGSVTVLGLFLAVILLGLAVAARAPSQYAPPAGRSAWCSTCSSMSRSTSRW